MTIEFTGTDAARTLLTAWLSEADVVTSPTGLPDLASYTALGEIRSHTSNLRVAELVKGSDGVTYLSLYIPAARIAA